MRLRNPAPVYTPLLEVQRNREIEAADAQNHKRGQDVEIGAGRLILTDANGVRYNVAVNTSGALTVTAI